MARPNSPEMPPKRTKKVRLGISTVYFAVKGTVVLTFLKHPVILCDHSNERYSAVPSCGTVYIQGGSFFQGYVFRYFSVNGSINLVSLFREIIQ